MEKEKLLDRQVGGDHYKKYKIQPIEFIHANNIPFIEGNIIKYVLRYKDKNGLVDLEKAKHYLDMLYDLHNQENKAAAFAVLEGNSEPLVTPGPDKYKVSVGKRLGDMCYSKFFTDINVAIEWARKEILERSHETNIDHIAYIHGKKLLSSDSRPQLFSFRTEFLPGDSTWGVFEYHYKSEEE